MMKKLTSLLLAGAMLFALAACGTKNDNTTGDAAEIPDALTLLTTVWDALPEDAKFAAAGGDFEHSVDDAPGKFEAMDADSLSYQLCFPEDDVELIDDAASLTHMMNSNTFTCGAYHVTDASTLSTLTADQHEKLQNQQWMCGFPDKMVILTVGEYMVTVYGADDLVDSFCDQVQTCYENVSVAYDEAIL